MRRALLEGREVLLAVADEGEWVLDTPLSELLAAGADALYAAVDAARTRSPGGLAARRPVDDQEIWASGVT